MTQKFKSGFVAVIGRPNVGKSTLMNRLVGQKIAIMSDKPQTTRTKLLGIRTTQTSQIIFVDTPGLHKPRTRLGEYMVGVADNSAKDADLILYVSDASVPLTNAEEEIIQKLGKYELPCILLLNKVDLCEKESLLPQIDTYQKLYPFDSIIPISAKKENGLELVVTEIEQHLPEGPEFYPEEMVTDMTEREITAEVVREKMLRLLDKEVPHGVAIEVAVFQEKENVNEIGVNIYCEKDSHKGIIIGKQGEMLKRIGRNARLELEEMMKKKVYLELWVKVKNDWRNNNHLIRDFGFDTRK